MGNHTPVTPRGYVYRAEAARTLEVGVSTLYRMINSGQVTVYTTANGWPCYRVSELAALRDQRARVRKG